jgi:hypothetical protein
MKRNFLLVSTGLVLLTSCIKDHFPPHCDGQFNNVYGGSENEGAYSIFAASDGGYLFGGWTLSNDQDVSGNHGREDVWLVKLDCNGRIQWQRAFGGSSSDAAFDITPDPQGNVMIAANTYSNDGDITHNNGGSDAWILKVDQLGNLVWEKNFGDVRGDDAISVINAPGGGYIVLIISDADVSGQHGNEDVWVIKLDNDGNELWRTVLNNDSYDLGLKIINSNDGGYILVGTTNSGNGDDAWVVKLDASGNKLWDKKFGGTSGDRFYSIITVDGGYVAVGSTNSLDGDVVGKHPGIDPNSGGEASDVWVVKFDESGNMIWQKCLGGSLTDQGYAIVKTSSGGYAISGATDSNDGDVSGNHGGYDAWIVEIDGLGNIVWQKTFGGTGVFGDGFHDLIKISGQDDYIAAGATDSNDGDITGNHGLQDAWVITIKTQKKVQ